MPTKVWKSGEELKAVDINTYLQNQTVMQFADAAARTAALPAPSIGMTSYLTSTGAIEVFTDKLTPAGWAKPWSVPWGITYNAVFPDITLNTTVKTLTSGIPVNIPGRLYKVEIEANYLWSSVQDLFVFSRFVNAGSQDTYGQWTLLVNWSIRVIFHDFYVGATTNALSVTAWTNVGTAVNQYGRVKVFDVGPV
jgi:hypothetical protein